VLTIGQLARRFGVSRSTLLYYDSIGLLRPSARSAANYRLYDDADVARMERIDLYRRVGVPLSGIGRVLDSGGGALREVLEARLRRLDEEIGALRGQQRLVARLLPGSVDDRTRPLDKQGWIAVLRATGLDDAAMRRWHVEFERLSPEGHAEFLVSLGIDGAEVGRIRQWSREAVGSEERSAGGSGRAASRGR